MEAGVSRNSLLQILGSCCNVDRNESWIVFFLDSNTRLVSAASGAVLLYNRLGDVTGSRRYWFFRTQHR